MITLWPIFQRVSVTKFWTLVNIWWSCDGDLRYVIWV